MNSGIVRRIDPSGRIVIPKGIRKNLNIKDGDPLQIRMSGKCIVLERFSPLSNLKEQSETFLKMFARKLCMAVAVCSLDTIVFYHGFSLSGNTTLTTKLQELIRKQQLYTYQPDITVNLTTFGNTAVNALYPIGCLADPAGGLALIRTKNLDATPEQMNTAEIIAKVLTELITL